MCIGISRHGSRELLESSFESTWGPRWRRRGRRTRRGTQTGGSGLWVMGNRLIVCVSGSRAVCAQVQVGSRRRGGWCQTRMRPEAPRRRPRLRRLCSSPRLDATRKTGAFGDNRWDLAGGLLAGLLEAVSKALGGRLRASFGPLFVLLGASWGGLGASVGRPGALLGRKAGFFSSWSLSGAPLGPVSGASWAVLSGSWAVWGPSWAVWGPSWAVLGASRGASWAILERY